MNYHYLALLGLAFAITYPTLLTLHPQVAKSTLSELDSTPYGNLLLNTIDLQLSASKSLSSSEDLLSQIESMLTSYLKTSKSLYSKHDEMCKRHYDSYLAIIDKAQANIENSQKRINVIIPLLGDAATYVPEKEQEVEQAKRWSETAWEEVDKEKIRFAEREHSYEISIEGCDKALGLIETLQSNPSFTLGESSKIASSLLQVSKSFDENSKEELSPLIKVLIELSVTHENISNPNNLEKISELLKDLKKDFEDSMALNKENHEKAIKGAIAYADEKRYTYQNLNRQDNIILDNQVKLQQEMYNEQLKIDAETRTRENAEKKLELLEQWCQAEDSKAKLQEKSIESELEICLNLKEISSQLEADTTNFLNNRVR
ncbi:unnamed protein product [Blepharisma stoltei]|uniref:Uncharacterized protein n=1 Tax=Blepharisma stoltei TaxID=1481888 RepID=A0AAU9IUX6_9CILI|nr:unnamed protein product [Blepharisma stoltei]